MRPTPQAQNLNPFYAFVYEQGVCAQARRQGRTVIRDLSQDGYIIYMAIVRVISAQEGATSCPEIVTYLRMTSAFCDRIDKIVGDESKILRYSRSKLCLRVRLIL